MRSAPQKQPRPNTACCKPAGNGALSGWPLMKCLSGTSIAALRPGSVLLAGSRLVIFFMNENIARSDRFAIFAQNKRMKLCIYGACAVGGVLAGWLVRYGHEDSLVRLGPQLPAILASDL